MQYTRQFPCCESIPVPEHIPEQEIGLYVSSTVRTLMDDLGAATSNPKSFNLFPIEKRFYVLRWESSVGHGIQYSPPKSGPTSGAVSPEKVLDSSRPDAAEPKTVAKNALPEGLTGRPVQDRTAGATRK